MSEIVVVTREPVKSADLYIKLLGTSLVKKSLGKSVEIPGGGCITVYSEDEYQERYGQLASGLEGRDAIFGALVFETAKDIKLDIQGEKHVEMERKESSLVLRVPKYDSVLEITKSGG